VCPKSSDEFQPPAQYVGESTRFVVDPLSPVGPGRACDTNGPTWPGPPERTRCCTPSQW